MEGQSDTDKKPAGTSLIKLMVAFLVIGLIAGVFAYRSRTACGRSPTTYAKQDLAWILTAAEMYKLDNGKYPESMDVLTQLCENTGEPYLLEIPKDPWDNDYIYRKEGSTVRVGCFGSDGIVSGTGLARDIWMPEEEYE